MPTSAARFRQFPSIRFTMGGFAPQTPPRLLRTTTNFGDEVLAMPTETAVVAPTQSKPSLCVPDNPPTAERSVDCFDEPCRAETPAEPKRGLDVKKRCGNDALFRWEI